MLPTDAKVRKALPIATGVLDYFPKALAAIAEVSRVGNEQHNPGSPLHWDRSKSTDEADALIRHFLDRGKLDNDGLRHSAKMAWRALALLEKEIEGPTRDALMRGLPNMPMTATEENIRSSRCSAGGVMGRCSRNAGHFGAHHVQSNICNDCGADLAETGHFVSCLSPGANRRL